MATLCTLPVYVDMNMHTDLCYCLLCSAYHILLTETIAVYIPSC